MFPNKRILNAGKGDPPSFQDGTKAIFHYRVSKVSEEGEGDVMDDSRLDWPRGYGQPMEIICGKQFKLPIWETCLRTMRPDEVAQFVLEPGQVLDYPFVSKQLRDLAKQRGTGHHGGPSCGSGGCMGALARTGLGYKELDEWLRGPTPLSFTFHLMRVLQPDEYEQESWTLSAEQKLNSIPALKESGNALFRQGRMREAEEKYCEALSRLESLALREKPGEPEWVELDKQKVPLYLNLAQVKMNQKEFYAAIEAATEALKREPDNTKALFRRAKAMAGVWNLEDARRDLDRVRQLDPTCSAMVEKEINIINQLQQKTNSDEAAQFRNMFR